MNLETAVPNAFELIVSRECRSRLSSAIVARAREAQRIEHASSQCVFLATFRLDGADRRDESSLELGVRATVLARLEVRVDGGTLCVAELSVEVRPECAYDRFTIHWLDGEIRHVLIPPARQVTASDCTGDD
jgi:hypothetical protein